jgi:transcriptional regulator with XRE-family HTH domain
MTAKSEHVNESVGRRLQRLRAEHGWSQAEVAERSGVPQPTISKIERGRKPRPGTGVRLAAAFGLTLDEFDPYALYRSGRAASFRVEDVEPGVGEDVLAGYAALEQVLAGGGERELAALNAAAAGILAMGESVDGSD